MNKLSVATPINNYVLIKLESNDSIKLDSGLVILMPPPSKQQNEENFKPLRGSVVSLPEKLVFKQGDHTSLKWKTEMELCVGDNVILKRPALSMALSKENGSYFIEDGNVFVYIKYDEIIVGKRGEEVVILNGYVIIEPEVIAYNTPLVIPEMAKKDSRMFGIVRFIGKPNQEYHITKNSKSEDIATTDEVFWGRKENGEFKIDAVELQPGDKVQFAPSTAIPLEQELFQTLAGRNQKLYRMQRFNILTKI